MSVMPPAARDLVDAIAVVEELLDRAEAPAVPGTTRKIVSDGNWWSAQLRLAVARRRAARDLTPTDAQALADVVAARAAATPIDPAHLASIRELVDGARRRHR